MRILSLLLLLLPWTASASIVIASYHFDGTGAGTPASSDAHATSDATAFTSGFGSLRYSTFATTSGSYSVAMLSNEIGRSAQDAIERDNYWSFTVTATTGTLDLKQLTFRYGGSPQNQVNQSSIFVRSSVDEYTSNLAFNTSLTTLDFHAPGGGGANAFVADAAVIDLSHLSEYQNLTTVTFHIYGYDDSGHGSAAGIRLDDLQLIAIPEPSSIFLTLLGAAAVLVRKRNH